MEQANNLEVFNTLHKMGVKHALDHQRGTVTPSPVCVIGRQIHGHVAQHCNPVDTVGVTVTMMVNALAALYVDQTTVEEFFLGQQTVVQVRN